MSKPQVEREHRETTPLDRTTRPLYEIEDLDRDELELIAGGIDEAATSDMIKNADRKESKDTDYTGKRWSGSGI